MRVARTTTRCGAVTLALALAVGPGAVAWADSDDDRPSAKPASSSKAAKATKAAKVAKAAKAAKAARTVKAAPVARPGKPAKRRLDRDTQPPRLAASLRRAADREDDERDEDDDLAEGIDTDCERCVVITDPRTGLLPRWEGSLAPSELEPAPVVVTSKKAKRASDPLPLLDVGPTPLGRPEVQGTSTSTRISTGGAIVRTASLTPVRARQVALRRPAAVGSSTSRPAAVALPDQGPTGLGGLGVPAASEADVPLFVALVGLLLVAVGMRRVGSFRRAGDPDLTWD